MNAIVSVTRDWGIGNEGRLLVRNPEDMRFFREKTMGVEGGETLGGTVVCGRTTFQSFPGGALKGRRNVVLSQNEAYAPEGAEVVHSVEDALAALRDEEPGRVWLIGGARVYKQLLGACDTAYVTFNDVVLPADVYFPNLDADPSWTLEKTLGSGVTASGIRYEFRVYRRVRA